MTAALTVDAATSVFNETLRLMPSGHRGGWLVRRVEIPTQNGEMEANTSPYPQPLIMPEVILVEKIDMESPMPASGMKFGPDSLDPLTPSFHYTVSTNCRKEWERENEINYSP